MKAVASLEERAIKSVLFALSELLRALFRRASRKRARQALSAAVTELLKIDPDIDMAKARLAAIEAIGESPSPEFLRAERMLSATEAYSAARKKTVRKKTARKKVVRRTTRRKTVRKAKG